VDMPTRSAPSARSIRISAGLSVVTNQAAGLSASPLTHDDVQRVAARAAAALEAVLAAFLPRAVPRAER